ncbi:TetR/AcrR family transcriptional regulator [Sphingobacterium sp. lm-10]|uniref:TetR/AcrR family transcriptional regulator n=1 Tax=Sphingobacterium sp. lm-10 TaxID=2944904 RepID=UPI0020210384|nr:TetR/AcrR family transcriptional regulator [Sphingobacterium sp. lm-10]MCL7989101.1 TetR/AcrR family transcriptional regulator [Sphingobacterium sp. lm-10]
MNVQYIDKREAIFQSTLELVQDNGFHGTPMSQVARLANVSVGTIYHYFESKEDLIMELYSYCKTKLMAYLFEGLAHDNHSYEHEFKIIWKRFVQFYTLYPSYFRFMNQFYSSPFHEMERRMREINQTDEDAKTIQGFLKLGSTNNKLRNISIQLLCSAFTGVAVSFVKSIIFGKVSMDPQQIDEMVDIVWTSIKA